MHAFVHAFVFWSCASMAAGAKLPTYQGLLVAEQEYRTLRDVTIPGYYAGRGSGRYHGTDTARMNMLRTVVLYDLRFGKLPSDEDRRALFMGHFRDLSKADQQWLQEWRNKKCRDPRKGMDEFS